MNKNYLASRTLVSRTLVSRSPTSANIDSFSVVSTNAIFNRSPDSIFAPTKLTSKKVFRKMFLIKKILRLVLNGEILSFRIIKLNCFCLLVNKKCSKFGCGLARSKANALIKQTVLHH